MSDQYQTDRLRMFLQSASVENEKRKRKRWCLKSGI